MAAPTLSFQLKLLFNEQTGDNWGNWQYAAATATATGVGQTAFQQAQLIATKRDNSHAGLSFPASMLTATLMFEASAGGVPPNLTLQGIHDLTTNNETGSVSSASPELAAYLGGAFSFDAASGILTISPAGRGRE